MTKYFLIVAFLAGMMTIRYTHLDYSQLQASAIDSAEVSEATNNPVAAIISHTSDERFTQFLIQFQQPGDFVILANQEDLNTHSQVLAFRGALRTYHPSSRIYTIYYNSDSDQHSLLKKIQQQLNSNDILVTFASFSAGMDENTASFHNHLALETLETFDLSVIPQLDTNDTIGLQIFMDYLASKEAQSSNIWAIDQLPDYTGIFVNFNYGPPSSSDRDLTILAFGDMMLGRHVRTLMDRHGMNYIFEKIHGPENRFFKGADVVFANLEGPIRGQGSKGGTSMVFSFNRDIAPFLKSYGFNLLSIANNHTFDQGVDGYKETVEVLEENDLGWCGDYYEPKAEAVHYGTVGDQKYAFICVQDVTVRLDIDATVHLIQEVRPTVDYLIVSPHWGYEYRHQPDQNKQITPAHRFIDAGADLIIGHHPHVVQTVEVYKDRYIFYSLGNFVFDQYFSTDTQQGLALGIILGKDANNNLTTKVHYFPLKSINSQPQLMPEGTKGWLPDYLKQLPF